MSLSLSELHGALKRFNRKRNRYLHEQKRRIRLVLSALFLRSANKHEKIPQAPQRVIFPFVNLGIGDAVCHTGLWRKLKDLGYRVQIIAETRSEVFFKGLDCVDDVFIVDIRYIDQLKKIDSDIVISMYSWMQRKELLEIKLLSRIDYNYAISIGGWLKRPYHITLDLPDNFHITEPQKQLLAALGHPCNVLHYWLNPLSSGDAFIKDYLQKYIKKTLIVLSPFASVSERTMTRQQIFDLIAKLQHRVDCNIFITGETHQLATLDNVPDNVFICAFDSLWHTVSLVNKADLVISVETAIVHVACALNKTLVSIFYSTNINYDDALQSNTIFKPIGENVQQIIVNRTTLPFDTDKVLRASLAMLAAADRFAVYPAGSSYCLSEPPAPAAVADS
ncbi:glycosyltransferase family 9 protein [Erwinia sp. 198]|uniref:glycosyltransferase family 9 protein n=1 Tax=Erwinia sp. 198 TaxID=2022746 RepID=UPI000F66E332|nr:glycosyltransferase family 9 protein [Erwinia sp. 198]RRZ86987.1 lipopolysaccharide heptosyltransferase family protein [Erwinia sp. 198]